MLEKNYIILSHNKPEQLQRLITQLDDSFSRFYVHIDKSADINQFSHLKLIKAVRLIRNRVKCIWGDFSLVQAVINCMRQIVKDNRSYYTLLLSGQDYPIASNKTINHYLQNNAYYDHFDISPVEELWDTWEERIHQYKINLSHQRGDAVILPYFFANSIKENIKNIGKQIQYARQRKSMLPLLEFTKTLKKKKLSINTFYGGSAWFGLSYPTLTKMLQFINTNKSYLTFHKSTLLPDEIFFHTLIKHLALTDAAIQIKPSLTYVNWRRKDVVLPVTFSENDFEELVNAATKNRLFARKFDTQYSKTLLHKIDEQISR